MAPQNTRFFDRRKFMWDGETYDSRRATETKKHEYENEGFETQLIEEEGTPLLYTRRVVKEVALDGAPPSV